LYILPPRKHNNFVEYLYIIKLHFLKRRGRRREKNRRKRLKEAKRESKKKRERQLR
jgi:hypothetical protein